MAVGSDSDPKVKRCWVAVSATAIKASTAASNVLAEHEKLPIGQNAQLTAVIEEEIPGYWIVTDATVNDAPVTANLRFLYMGHWELLPLVEPGEIVADDAKPQPEAIEEFAQQENSGVIEAEVASQASPPVRELVIDSQIGLKPSKPISQRRLFALFRRGGSQS